MISRLPAVLSVTAVLTLAACATSPTSPPAPPAESESRSESDPGSSAGQNKDQTQDREQSNNLPTQADGEPADAAALGQEFDESLNTFDDRMRRERAGIEQERAASGAFGQGGRDATSGRMGPQGGLGSLGGPGGPGGEPGADGGPPMAIYEGQIPPGEPGTDGGDGEQPPETSTRPGSPGNRAALPPPDDVPGGQNDDVVARQLREAAEAETDPELRKRLWNEYKRYKNRQSEDWI